MSDHYNILYSIKLKTYKRLKFTFATIFRTIFTSIYICIIQYSIRSIIIPRTVIPPLQSQSILRHVYICRNRVSNQIPTNPEQKKKKKEISAQDNQRGSSTMMYSVITSEREIKILLFVN